MEDAVDAIDRVINEADPAMFDVDRVKHDVKRIYEIAKRNGAVMIVIKNDAVQSGRRPHALGYLTKEHFEKINEILRQHVKLNEEVNADVFYNFTYREYAVVYLLHILNIEPSATKERGIHGADAYYLVRGMKRYIEIKGSYISQTSQRDRVVKIGRMDARWSFGNAPATETDEMMRSMSAFAFAVFCRDDAIPALMIYVRKNQHGDNRHYDAVLKMILKRIADRREKLNIEGNKKKRSDAHVYIDHVIDALYSEKPPYHNCVNIVFNKQRITHVYEFIREAKAHINDAISYGTGRKALELHLPSRQLAESIIRTYKDIVESTKNLKKPNNKIITRSGAPHKATYFVPNSTAVCIYKLPSTYIVFDHNVPSKIIAQFHWGLKPVDTIMSNIFKESNMYVYERFDHQEHIELWWYQNKTSE